MLENCVEGIDDMYDFMHSSEKEAVWKIAFYAGCAIGKNVKYEVICNSSFANYWYVIFSVNGVEVVLDYKRIAIASLSVGSEKVESLYFGKLAKDLVRAFENANSTVH